jgi:hypothetical protein
MKKEKRTAKILIALTASEKTEFSAVAGDMRITLSNFIRETMTARCAYYRRQRERAAATAIGTAPEAPSSSEGSAHE